METTITPVILTARPRKDGRFSIYLRFHREAKSEYSRLPELSTKEHYWDAKKGRVNYRHPDYDWVNECIQDAIVHAWEVQKELRSEVTEYTARDLKHAFEGREEGVADFFAYVKEWLVEKRLLANNPNARGSYDYWYVSQSALNLFKQCVGAPLKWSELTRDKLHQWDRHMIERGNTGATRRAKLQVLANVVKSAIKAGKMSRIDDPFDLFDMPKAEKPRKVKLPRKVVEAMGRLELPDGSDEEFARNLYVFSFLMRGPRVGDVLTMRWKDLQDGRWKYVTSKSWKALSITIAKPAQEILNRYGPPGEPDEFVFTPMRRIRRDPASIRRAVRNEGSRANKAIKAVAKEAGFTEWEKVTMHTSRHSWAYMAYKNSVTVEVIRESLGHSRITTTMQYLDDLDDEAVDAQVDWLVEGWG